MSVASYVQISVILNMNRYDTVSYAEIYKNLDKPLTDDDCVCCGSYAGEGRQTCVNCDSILKNKG